MSQPEQTRKSFKEKWENNPDLAFAETLREGSDIFRWITNRNGFATPADFQQWLAPRRRILDAGCGNGRVTALLRKYASAEAEIVGIDLTAADVARANLDGLPRVSVLQKDLLGSLEDLGRFDLIYCQEVLHHTANPRQAFLNVAGLLSAGGEIAIYVYKLKAPLREHADDYVRDRVSRLSYEDALVAMNEITAFGKALAELNTKVTAPEVKVLGIEAGEYDVQRLIYHFFLKCFWNPDLSFDDNVAINYDWYHPQLSTRHTADEVAAWFAQAGLRVVHTVVDHYGITMRGVRA
jgi:SAM-dependent methyltransferase